MIVGVDPGARNTAVLSISDSGAVFAVTVHNEGPLLPVPRDYLTRVVQEIHDMTRGVDEAVTVRVEGVTRPNWHVAKAAGGGSASNPEALLGTAQVLGAVLSHFPCEVVAPGGHGSKPMGAYPPELVSDGERRRPGWELRVGTGKLRHQRSAWDIAHTPPVGRVAPTPVALVGQPADTQPADREDV